MDNQNSKGKIRRRIVERIIGSIANWNEDIHNALEMRIQDEDKKYFPPSPKNEEEREARNQRIEKMREFYYGRMINTASLMVAMSSLVVALVALVVALVK